MNVGKIKKSKLKNYKNQPIKNKVPTDRKFSLFFFLIIIIILGATFFYSYNKDKADPSNTLIPTSEIINSLSKVIFIEESEAVKVALIKNADDLRKANPTFYENAQNGDYYVVLPESSRVLIYRKEENKLINFSTFTLNIDAIDESLIPEGERPLNIEIRYTDRISEEELNKFKTDITSTSELYTITSLTKVTNSNLSGLSIVILNYENKPNLIQNFLADSKINAISQQLPKGEDTSAADLIVFLSK
jgi:hypothetical protein